MDIRFIWFWINNIPGIGNLKLRKLIEYFGDPIIIWEADAVQLRNIWELTEQDIGNILSRQLRTEISARYESAISSDLHIIYPIDDNYPKALLELYDHPMILYYRGELRDNERRVAIVGSRRSSQYGRSMAMEIARQLSTCGYTVVSGLANGIDSEAHKGAVYAGGRTYAVLAADPMAAYPKQNYNLYMDILRDGCVLSEYGPGVPTVPGLFPMRNRIISGLCEATIVIEAGEHSGSLITASMALEQNRRVIALPGRVSDGGSVGCNRLISEGAEIITSIDELMDSFGKTNDSQRVKLNIPEGEQEIYDFLYDYSPHNFQEILRQTNKTEQAVFQAIIGLVFKGLIKEISKNYYVRIR